MIRNGIKAVAGLMILCMGFLSCGGSEESNKEADVQENRLVRLHYENSGGERGVTTFAYNRDKSGYMAIWELLDGSRNSLNFYECDSSGNTIRKYREFSDGLTSTEIFEHDADNKITAEHFERSDGIGGSIINEYDVDGRQIRSICDKHKGWLTAEIKYNYDSSGVMSSADIFDQGEPAGTIAYTYDDNGNLIKEYWDFSGRWNQTFVYEYEVDDGTYPNSFTSSNPFIASSDDYRLSKENYDYSGETGGPSTFSYDDDGNLVGKRFERSDGLSTETTYLYDRRGRLMKSYRQYSNGLTAVFNYVFDNANRMIERSFIRTDGVSGSEKFEYSPEGRLLTATYDKMDGWLTGTITFEHDTAGNLKAGTFDSVDDNDAEIDFGYDENGNLTRIYWSFPGGQSQTYTFVYDKVI